MNKPCLFFSFLFLGLIVALAISTVCAANPDNITINDNSVTLDQYGEIVPIEETEKIEINEPGDMEATIQYEVDHAPHWYKFLWMNVCSLMWSLLLHQDMNFK